MRIEIGRVIRTSDKFPGIFAGNCTYSTSDVKLRLIKNVRSTLKSVNMAAVGIFIGANIIFIIGFAILFVCQKRILTKVSIPNIDLVPYLMSHTVQKSSVRKNIKILSRYNIFI